LVQEQFIQLIRIELVNILEYFYLSLLQNFYMNTLNFNEQIIVDV